MANTVLERLLNDKGVDQLWSNVCRYVNSRTAALGTVTLDDNVVLLWENASPGSAISTQTIPHSALADDYKKYDLFLYICTFGSDQREISTLGHIDRNVIASFSFGSSSKVWVCYRTLGINANGFYIGTGYNATPSTDTATDAYVIPTHLYGIKLNDGALSTVNGINYELSEADYDELMGMLGE